MRHLEQGGRDHSSAVEGFVEGLSVLPQYFFILLDPVTSVFEGSACRLVGVFPLKSKEVVFEFCSS